MRCISKSKRIFLIGCAAVLACSQMGCQKKQQVSYVTEYEKQNYNKSLYEGSLLASDLCVAEEDVSLAEYDGDTDVHAAALFDLEDSKVLYSYQMHDRLYPASVTKIMTALLALERGNLSDIVTISDTASASSFPSDAQVCGLRAGEKWSLEALLNALLLYSGNDAATAIAEQIAGSEQAFVALMNERAKELMANNTHFMNPHGLHDQEHYTTAYDLYLIFQECIKDERFLQIIQSESYTASYTGTDGETLTETFEPTNLYARGVAEKPTNVTIVGGKTGTTGEAGYCLILLEYDAQTRPYISVVMGAAAKSVLYEDMTSMIQAIPE